MKVIDIFEQITRLTVPSGQEDNFRREFLSDFEYDSSGNSFVTIGNSDTIFCAHTDDVSRDVVTVSRMFDGRYFRTDGSSVLGADDKAGVAVLLYMIAAKKPGRYIFFAGEEAGHIGSKQMRKDMPEILAGAGRIVAIDRKGYASIVYRQGSITASKEFTEAVSDEFCNRGMFLYPDDTGVSSDTVSFADIIPECINLSAGYFKAHSPLEFCDMKFLQKLADSMLEIDFDKIPIFRKILAG